jgi:hypothetical protein
MRTNTASKREYSWVWAPPVRGGRFGQAAVDHETLAEPGPDVGGPEGDELLVGVDLVAVLGGVCSGCGHRFGEPDEDDAEGSGE